MFQELIGSAIKISATVTVYLRNACIPEQLWCHSQRVTGVRGTKRLRIAGFHSAVGYLKRELGCRLELRNVPELKFIYDESFDRAAALNEVFETMHNETN